MLSPHVSQQTPSRIVYTFTSRAPTGLGCLSGGLLLMANVASLSALARAAADSAEAVMRYCCVVRGRLQRLPDLNLLSVTSVTGETNLKADCPQGSVLAVKRRCTVSCASSLCDQCTKSVTSYHTHRDCICTPNNSFLLFRAVSAGLRCCECV